MQTSDTALEVGRITMRSTNDEWGRGVGCGYKRESRTLKDATDRDYNCMMEQGKNRIVKDGSE
jgi:hypothetical protein